MRRLLLGLSIALLMPALAQAGEASRPQLSSQQCGLSTPYNVLVDTGGVWLYRDEGSPKEVFFHDGELSVDKQVRAVSDADARRLRQLEYAAYQLMPEVAGIARDSVEVTFDALGGAVEIMTGSKRKARQLDSFRADTLDHVNRTLGMGRWDQDVFDETFEAKIEAAAESIAASMTRSVMWTVLTGGAGRIERRAEKMEAELERTMDIRAQAIEARADALCPRIEAIHALQAALEYRYNGQPLEFLEMPDAARESSGDNIVVAH